MATTVVIIDDHALFRKGVMQMISSDPEFDVIGEAASGLQGLSLVEQLKPGLALIDLNMKVMNGIETLTRIKEAKLDTKCIVLTVSDAEDDLLEALRAGADGYLLKDMEPEDLCASLKKAMSGITVLHESLTDILKNALVNPTLNKQDDDVSLTEREREILECLARGLNNKTIARHLGISDTTVKVHIKHLLSKLKLTSRLEAAVWAHTKKVV
ncbi:MULTISPECIES: two-component system response regulator NarL [unclassified Methylophilus]|jgi:two-component system, NarL family, nitrate/nitrite response regulator NarL|uniref:two-component system response regulator NarL n=1 Tax=unclassified Methylophilus TaxID=2630143 RepID=UPI0003616E01|nr:MULTISPECIES: two-component system response regulator NarL [unclassified Methylophilus]